QYAIEDGVVLSAGKDSAGGIFAWIKYPRLNKKLLHYHLSKVVVKAGQKVNSDTLVGYTGKTGRATGIHLHLGLMDLSSGKYENADTYVIPEVVVPTPSEEITYKVVK
ncbi:MAG TPA: M23 family metallopeptidase, partial [Spirochaetota bacterium]|nr:M23 family metallopeptidase [Spirochaetota bacterium]